MTGTVTMTQTCTVTSTTTLTPTGTGTPTIPRVGKSDGFLPKNEWVTRRSGKGKWQNFGGVTALDNWRDLIPLSRKAVKPFDSGNQGSSRVAPLNVSGIWTSDNDD